MLALAIYLLSSTINIIFTFFIKKTLIYIQNQELYKNYFLSSKNWWPFTSRNSNTYKSFRTKPIIKKSNLGIILWIIKSGWLANTSKLIKIASLILSFSIFYKYFIWQINKFISLNCSKNKKFIMFFIYHCWNKILQKQK